MTKLILIKNKNKYKYFNETKWETINGVITDYHYQEFGMTPEELEEIQEKYWTLLKGEIKVFIYIENSNEKEVTIKTKTNAYTIYDEFGDSLQLIYRTRDESILNPKLNIIANYTPLDEFFGQFKLVTLSKSSELYLMHNQSQHDQLILSHEDLNITRITSFLLNVKQEHDNVLKILISSDRGENWRGRSTVDLKRKDELLKYGFSVEDILSWTEEDIKNLAPHGYLRFGFYIRELSPNSITLINNLIAKEKLDFPETFVSKDDGNTWEQVIPDAVTNLEAEEGVQLRVKVVLDNGQELYGISYSWT